MRISGFIAGVALTVVMVLILVPGPANRAADKWLSWTTSAPYAGGGPFGAEDAGGDAGAIPSGTLPVETEPVPMSELTAIEPDLANGPTETPPELNSADLHAGDTPAPIPVPTEGDSGSGGHPQPPETVPNRAVGNDAAQSGPASDTSPAAGEAAHEERWESFFTPFHSEASALGFARFLQSATGRTFVVRRAGPGDYRIWFSMAEGENLPGRLAEIEAATGMMLAGGEL